MCMDLAAPNTNMTSGQKIKQCIDGEYNEGEGKNKRFPIQKDERLEKHQSERSIVNPNQHFEGKRKSAFLK